MRYLRYLPLLFALCIFNIKGQSFPKASSEGFPRQKESSVMKSGKWVKIKLKPTGGLYKITFDELKKIGFDNPQSVGVYGYGGALLPENLNRFRATDIPQVPVLQENNTLYFYAPGLITWYYNSDKDIFSHTTNIYSNDVYMLLSDAEAPLMMKQIASKASSTTQAVSRAVVVHEKDNVSLAYSGRQLFGEPLTYQTNYTFDEKVPQGAYEVNKVCLRYVARREKTGQNVSLQLNVNGQKAIQYNQTPHGGEIFGNYIKGYDLISYNSPGIKVSPGQLQIGLNYSQKGLISYLDYYELNVLCNTTYTPGNQLTLFYSPQDMNGHGDAVKYMVKNADKNLKVIKVSVVGEPQLCPTQSDGSFTDDAPGNHGAIYLAAKLSDAYTPDIVGEISNQDLKGFENPDLLIISTNALLPEAKRLAKYHEEADGMKVLVTTQSEVFNEYTGGVADATAYRIFAKTFYDRWKSNNSDNQAICPIQLLLFGDGAYDNRKLTNEWKQPAVRDIEFLLTYQSCNSLDVYTYIADSYFGALDEKQSARQIGAQDYQIGIGRMPVRTLDQARACVTKTISYAEDRQPGPWKNRAVFMADNGDGFSHFTQSGSIANALQKLCPSMIIERLPMDMFERINVNGQTTVPVAKQKLHDALNKGILLLNYNGHGGPQGWGDEQIITMNSVKSMNYKNLPIWITATCDFANFDNFATSAGEEAFLNKKGGAAVLYTTTRVVMDIPNRDLNESMMKQMFGKVSDGKTRFLGTILSEAKNNLSSSYSGRDTINSLSFTLLGDPAIRIKLPTRNVVLKSINGQSCPASEGKLIPLQALQNVQLEGVITDHDGNEDHSFSGQLFITVYDSRQTMETIPIYDSDGNPIVRSFEDYPSIIYAGIVDVKEGKFTTEFIVPKDLIYNGTEGRISLFAYDSKQKIEAVGQSKDFTIVHGTAEEDKDVPPPTIESMYFGDENFKQGGVVNETPLFVANLFDKYGISYSGLGTGHSITLSIDNKAGMTYNLNDYYTPSKTEAGKGKVAVVLPKLPEGDHIATFTVWNIYNKEETQSIDFRVVSDCKPSVEVKSINPSPVRDSHVTFKLLTNQPGTNLDCYVELYDFTGRVVLRSPKELVKAEADSEASLNVEVDPAIPDGLYVYRIFLGNDTNKMATTQGKLIIQRQ